VELASRGYNVVGYDLSLTMLALAADEAQNRGQKLNFLQGDMREMAFEEMFDGVFSWATSFGYFDHEKNCDVLRRVQRALRTGGMFLLDIVNRDFLISRTPTMGWFEGDGCVCMDEAKFDCITSRLQVKRTLMLDDGRSREVEFSIRLYSLHEIGKMVNDAGFKVVDVSGHPATTGVFMGAESPRLITLAEKR
jgi:SAM-dependent methyltransferase